MGIDRRRVKFYRRKINKMLTLSIFIMIFTVGYALVSTSINITGTGYIERAEWNVHFANVQVKSGSVTATTAPTISNNTSVSFVATLANPGDFYEFNIDVENTGTMVAMIDSFTITPTLTTTQANYFDYHVTYSDGVALANKQILDAGDTETLTVSFLYKTLENAALYPFTDQSFQFGLTINYVQADSTAITVGGNPSSFATDSWSTIFRAVRKENTSAYIVGDTKTIDMGTLGTHTLRIANTTTPAECETTGFSETACGFVLEFVDIIIMRKMNITYTNVGGWPASEMRTYLNSDIYNALPEQLRNGIVSTVVVSGHGSTSGETNFTSTDKLYLFSPMEVWGNNLLSDYDTARSLSRQLDYYSNIGVSNSSYTGAIKQYNSENDYWWLRAAFDENTTDFNTIASDGSFCIAGSINGVSPAFRIG